MKLSKTIKAISEKENLTEISLEIESPERITFLQGVRKPKMVNLSLPTLAPEYLAELSGGLKVSRKPFPGVPFFGEMTRIPNNTSSNLETEENQIKP